MVNQNLPADLYNGGAVEEETIQDHRINGFVRPFILGAVLAIALAFLGAP